MGHIKSRRSAATNVLYFVFTLYTRYVIPRTYYMYGGACGYRNGILYSPWSADRASGHLGILVDIESTGGRISLSMYMSIE